MSKKLDQSITTIKNFRHATEHLNGNIQMYIQLDKDIYTPNSDLIEITEVQLVLPKDENEASYLVLRGA